MAGAFAFLAEGFHELGRKASRSSLRRRLASKDRDRRQALTALGQAAWQAKIDLSSFHDLRGQLEQLDSRAGDLSATTARLDQERAEQQTRRQAEVSRFDGLLAPAKAAQSLADSELGTARATLAEKDRAIRASESELAGLAKSLAALTTTAEPTSPAGTTPPGPSAAERREQILARQQVLIAQTAADQTARARVVQDVEARTAESQRRAAETARINDERKTALQAIDAELARIAQAVTAAGQDRAAVGRDQDARFHDLGAALYERSPAEAVLAEPVRAIAAVDEERRATQAAIDHSLSLTQAMAPGTLTKFWAVVGLVAVALAAAFYGIYARASSDPFGLGAASPAASTPPGTASPAALRASVAEDERRKDEVVLAFTKAPADAARRKDGVDILAADVRALGSSADRSVLPLLLTILEKGEPELRAAAAAAIGMIGPGAAEAAALKKAFNDPMPGVRDQVLPALEHLSDPAVRLLALRVAGTGRAASSDDFVPTLAPDAARLGTPIYPGATFLTFASDFALGRVSFSSADPVQKVVDYYKAAAPSHPPVGGEEFSRLYFGGSREDPSGVNAINEATQAWLKQAVAAQMPQAQMDAEFERRRNLLLTLPLLRYGEASIYDAPLFIALEAAAPTGSPRVVRYVVVFQDHSIGQTGIEYHVSPEGLRK